MLSVCETEANQVPRSINFWPKTRKISPRGTHKGDCTMEGAMSVLDNGWLVNIASPKGLYLTTLVMVQAQCGGCKGQ